MNCKFKFTVSKDAEKSWARVITKYDTTRKGIFKFVGDQWLKSGVTYELPVGSLVLRYIVFKERSYVLLVQVTNRVPEGECVFSSDFKDTQPHWLKQGDPSTHDALVRKLYATWGSYDFATSKFSKGEDVPEDKQEEEEATPEYKQALQALICITDFAKSPATSSNDLARAHAMLKIAEKMVAKRVLRQ